MKINQLWRYRRLCVAVLLLTAMAAPAIAEGTKAGTKITNEASATYRDPNNPNETVSTVSNIVEVTVAA